MNSSRIKTIDFQSSNAPTKLVQSIKETGFAVIRNHGLDKKLINDVYDEWKIFFNSNQKFDFMYDVKKQDGYFPMKSESAKGYISKDLKEFYHIYLPWGRIPENISDKSIEIRNNLVNIGSILLEWIDDNTPENVRKYFSIPLKDMIKDSQNNLLRILHYPPITHNEEEDALRASPHGDINLITILLSGSEPGLQLLTLDGDWIDVPCNKGWLIINSGDMLNKCSNNFYPSTIHRVINPKGSDRTKSRYSMPLFLHARDEVVLSKNYTAKSFLEERLKELGLK